jgi:hypothetical protein
MRLAGRHVVQRVPARLLLMSPEASKMSVNCNLIHDSDPRPSIHITRSVAFALTSPHKQPKSINCVFGLSQ